MWCRTPLPCLITSKSPQQMKKATLRFPRRWPSQTVLSQPQAGPLIRPSARRLRFRMPDVRPPVVSNEDARLRGDGIRKGHHTSGESSIQRPLFSAVAPGCLLDRAKDLLLSLSDLLLNGFDLLSKKLHIFFLSQPADSDPG